MDIVAVWLTDIVFIFCMIMGCTLCKS